MSDAALQLRIDGPVAVLHLDDGKANALSHEVIEAMHDGLDRALAEAGSVVIAGRPGRFSAGFDLKIMSAGDKPMQDLVLAGAELLLRIYAHPQPVVAACTGHALAGGALLLLASDTRIGAEGEFKIGLNELAIGMPLPVFALELARDRISSHLLTKATLQAELYEPGGAVVAGYLDWHLPADKVIDEAIVEARRLSEHRRGALAATKARLRGATLRRIRATLTDDIAELTFD
jgi:enoyl-CoA hydratase